MKDENNAGIQEVVFLDKRAVEPFTTSEVIAQHAGVKHHAVQGLILKYQPDFEEFGKVAFQMRPLEGSKTGQKEKLYHLNEEQATLLLTYLKNTPKVRAFKKELVRQFYEMRRLLLERQSDAWKQARADGKAVRRMETDAIKAFVDYASKSGSKHPEMYYKHFTDLAHKFACIEGGTRDIIAGSSLLDLRFAEQVIGRAVLAELEKGTEYHAAFQNVKEKLQRVGTLTFPIEAKRGKAQYKLTASSRSASAIG